jgi:hypothetical protein
VGDHTVEEDREDQKMNHFKLVWFHRYVVVVPLLVVLGACAPVLTSNTTTPPAPSTPVLDTPAPVVTPSLTAKVEKGNSADETDEPSADRYLVSYRGTDPHYESSPPFEIVYSPSFWEYRPGDGPERVTQLVHRDRADCSLSLGAGGMEALPVSTLNLAGTEWNVFQVQPQHLQYLSRWDDSFFLFSLALPEAYADDPEEPCQQAVQDVPMTFRIEGELPAALPSDNKGPLVVREWPIVPATVIGPGRLEYNDALGEEILSHIRALRNQSAERSLALANDALVPFGYRLDSRSDAGWNRTFYDLYREGEAEPLLPGLSPLWEVPLKASVDASGTDFILVVETAPNTRPLYLLVNSDEVQEWDSGESWARPGYLGDDAAFGFARIGDRPFYFFEKDGLVQISYGGQVLPSAFEQVFHNHCCEAAIHNVEFTAGRGL